MLKALALVPFFAATPGQSLFTWTDSEGTVHYTDDASRVPKGLRPADAKKTAEPLPFPLVGATEANWATDKPECRDALATVRRAQLDVRKAELELVVRSEKYAPCHAFNLRCYSPMLTMAAWEKECQQVPAACSVNVDGQVEYAEQLRDRLEELITWFEGMAKWGCFRPSQL